MQLLRDIPKSLILGVVFTGTLIGAASKERPPQTAQVTIQAAAACTVELDDKAAGATDAKGFLLITDVDPGDHYLHIGCPGKTEAAFFISPHPNENLLLPISKAPAPVEPAAGDPTSVEDRQVELRRLVQQAVQFRGQGHLNEAVASLREAFKLNPENSDLHRELGITFLLNKDWKRARVEMIEAIRHDQADADAHNGLGYALEKLGDLDGAIKEYRIATHLDPDNSTYRTHYLDALVKGTARQQAKK